MAIDRNMWVTARALARYLRANPLASDTVTGIERWWLGPEHRPGTATLLAVLDWMAGRGLLDRSPAADGHVRFRRADIVQDFERAVEHALRVEEAPGSAPARSVKSGLPGSRARQQGKH